jgi:hypothetical protein
MLGRRREVRRIMRRRRRRVMVAGAMVVGATSSMVKMSQADADKIQRTTGKAPEDMDEQELQQAMQQTGVQAQPVTEEDQQAMASAEAADPEQE